MSQNKEGSEKQPGVKIQDLSPKKDAKGGGVARPDGGGMGQSGRGPNPSGGGAGQSGGGAGQSGGGVSSDTTQGNN